MAQLGRIIVEALILHYGRDAVLERLAHPFWFQSLGCVMGMDWHSSGITTSVLGALKRGLGPVAHELGIHVCGGRGKHSRRTPDELRAVARATGLDGEALARVSRLVAKVDNTAVQDGHQIYLHGFIVADDGKWVVVQQGMRGTTARRYHWTSVGLKSFLDDPQTGIAGAAQPDPIINFADARADTARQTLLQRLAAGPTPLVDAICDIRGRHRPAAHPSLPHLTMPAHHDVRPKDVYAQRLHATLAAACENAPENFETFLLTRGLGPRTLESLAMVSEVIHGAPVRFTDPARFSLSHGGKDAHPYPVPVKVYDETLRVMRDAVGAARLGNSAKMAALRRLEDQARALEGRVDGPGVAAHIEHERRISHRYGGRSVFGFATPDHPVPPKPRRPTKPAPQPSLPGLG
jgi:hypothetical protein